MAHGDPYADIDFDEITEQTGLAGDEIKCLKVSSQPSSNWLQKNLLVLCTQFPSSFKIVQSREIDTIFK